MMSNEMIEVPFEGKAGDKAVLLLEAAEKAGLDPSVVRTRDGGFYAPEAVVKSAGLMPKKSADKAPAKKAAKKAPAKKAAAKKATAKKAAAKPAAAPAGDDDKAQE